MQLSAFWVIYRTFYLPNPFTNFFEDANAATSFNFLIGRIIIWLLSYGITHIYYESGSCKTFGSLSYTFWFIVNTYLFTWIIETTTNQNVTTFLLVFTYIIIIGVICYLTRKMKRNN